METIKTKEVRLALQYDRFCSAIEHIHDMHALLSDLAGRPSEYPDLCVLIEKSMVLRALRTASLDLASIKLRLELLLVILSKEIKECQD